jgi:ribosomal protein L11 methyltransferase
VKLSSKTPLWQASATVTQTDVARAEEALEEDALAVSSFETAREAPLWRVTAIYPAPPDRVTLMAALGQLGKDLAIEPVPAKDWVAESHRQLQPVEAGRYYIHGAHDAPHPLPSRIDLLIEAGQAFGTGQHASTYGCLLAFDQLAKQRRRPRVLDLGCGSGVLALAAARTWRCGTLASDIDPVAVKVARENAATNRLAPMFRAIAAAGMRHRVITAAAPFDLIFANILARPLIHLAPAMRQHVAPGGNIVLSGLLAGQEPMVRNAYRMQGFRLLRRIARDGWHTLVLRQPACNSRRYDEVSGRQRCG